MGVKFGSIKTIQGKKGNTYCVQIRMKGYPHISKTFKELKEAKSWLKETSYAMSTGQPYETKVMRTQTFSQLIDKYIEEKVDKTSSNYITRWSASMVESTFATKLAQCLDLPIYHLDKHFYVENWIGS